MLLRAWSSWVATASEYEDTLDILGNMFSCVIVRIAAFFFIPYIQLGFPILQPVMLLLYDCTPVRRFLLHLFSKLYLGS